MNVESEFQDFILQTNKDGSNKARSYLLALKSVNTLLRGGFLPEFDIGDIYDVTDVEALNRLGRHIHKEGRDPSSRIHTAPIPKSHVNGATGGTFCGSAVLALAKFLQNELEDAATLAQCSAAKTPREAADAISASHVTKRMFRKVVLDNYGNACCLTNLDIRETLQASTIDPDAGERAKFQPDNALCLSATYAEAFKAHLITFDEKLRLVLSKSLREHTTSNIFNAVFKQYENTRIRSALHFPPAEKFLARHRELLAG